MALGINVDGAAWRAPGLKLAAALLVGTCLVAVFAGQAWAADALAASRHGLNDRPRGAPLFRGSAGRSGFFNLEANML